MSARARFYLTELEVRRKRRLVSRDAVPSWSGVQFVAPETVAEVVRDIIGLGAVREYFLIFCLDARNKLIGFEVAHVGLQSEVQTSPAEILRVALLCGASAIIIAHNHPSDDPTPSTGDLLLTQALVAASEIVGVRVLDHVVVTDSGFQSIAEEVRS